MTVKIVVKLRLWQDHEVAIGPGKADLLAAIGHTGSISAAARSMEMSYRRAETYVCVRERAEKKPVCTPHDDPQL